MENILILDTETTGLDAKTCKILEVAAVFYNVKSRAIVHQASTLLRAEENPAAHINNIAVDLLKSVDESNERMSLSFIDWMMSKCDAIVAHNARFDRGFVDMHPTLSTHSKIKRWICSKEDIKWPYSGSLKLITIAENMKVPVISAHRALPDCVMLAECLGKLTDLEDQLNGATIDKDVYVANVSYHEREIARNAGFHWNSIVPNQWAKRMNLSEVAKINFRITKVSLLPTQ